jgi:putative lipoprotein
MKRYCFQKKWFFRYAAFFFFGAGYQAVAVAQEAVIDGTAIYRERIAVPSDVVLDVTLEEMSNPDAKPEVIGRARMPSPNQSPIKFSIEYDAARVNPANRYTLRARMTLGGQLLFVADAVDVLLTERRTTAVLLLRKQAAGTPIPRSAVDLENTYWRLTTLGHSPVKLASGQREIYLLLQPAEQRVVGFAGCNPLISTYRLNGKSIAFTKVTGNLIACHKSDNAEKAFHAALSKVNRWSIEGERLELFDATGQSLAQFESRFIK